MSRSFEHDPPSGPLSESCSLTSSVEDLLSNSESGEWSEYDSITSSSQDEYHSLLASFDKPAEGDDARLLRIGRYEIIQKLNDEVGEFFLAYDPQLVRKVAIKVPNRERPIDENINRRFLEEGKKLANINHPSIVHVHDLGTDSNGTPFVVMQFVEGHELGRHLFENDLSLHQRVNLLLEICRGLMRAHSGGVVHRNLKPENVIVDASGGIHLVDFAMALSQSFTPEEIRQRIADGTIVFMSPESLNRDRQEVDARTDIWSFGMIMYLMLKGKIPRQNLDNLTTEQLFESPNLLPLHPANAEMQELNRICFRCIEKDVDKRYQTISDCYSELEHTQQQLQILLESPSALGAVDPVQKTPHLKERENETPVIAKPLCFKGMMPFDENDSDDFLELLPGPRDHTGLPESIRFWLSRLGKYTTVEQIGVGVIYGPAGCGKSSFARAALLPRLSNQVTTIHIDCSRISSLQDAILKQIKAFGITWVGNDLASTLNRLRQGEATEFRNRKLVLVLDQFEHWLGRRSNSDWLEIIRGLKCCDSEFLQTLLIARDDYWLSLSQFVRRLGYRLDERQNSMNLPLPNSRHTSKVLSNFLFTSGFFSQCAKQQTAQSEFVKRIVNEVSFNNRVLWRHLAVVYDSISEIQSHDLPAVGALEFSNLGAAYLERRLPAPSVDQGSQFFELCAVILKELTNGETKRLPNVPLRRIPKLVAQLRGVYFKASTTKPDLELIRKSLQFLEQEICIISLVEDPENTAEPAYRLTHRAWVDPIRSWLASRNQRGCHSWSDKLRYLLQRFRR